MAEARVGYREIAEEMLRLQHIADITPDGLPEGPGESECNLIAYVLDDHFDDIIAALYKAADFDKAVHQSDMELIL